jgi:ACS family hexuronate transporter-like MFS transporter
MEFTRLLFKKHLDDLAEEMRSAARVQFPEPQDSDADHRHTPRAPNVRPVRWRWVALGVFVFAAVLNYLDRQLLAAVAPTLMREFGISHAQYGLILSMFAAIYAVATPFAGLFIDAAGIVAGVSIAVTVWSLAGAASGLTRSFSGLIGCRAVLGLAEASGIPAASKTTAMYLQPSELGMGIAFQAVGITLGSIMAPLLVGAMAPRYGWRSAFLISGGLGFVWVLLWWFTAKQIPPQANFDRVERPPIRGILSDGRFWGLIAANALVMTVYTLWINWTTIYFVQERHLTAAQANREFAWIPPVFATLGGLFGGWLSYRRIRRGADPLTARLRVSAIMAPLLLVNAVVPVIPTPELAVAALSLAFFSCMTILTNLQVIPIDLFGPTRAAFTTAALSCSYAATQMVFSPLIGLMVDRLGFAPICVAMSVLSLLGVQVLHRTMRPQTRLVAKRV